MGDYLYKKNTGWYVFVSINFIWKYRVTNEDNPYKRKERKSSDDPFDLTVLGVGKLRLVFPTPPPFISPRIGYSPIYTEGSSLTGRTESLCTFNSYNLVFDRLF